VIIAEEITSRFFNVIRLLNRAVPIIAIQLSAFQIDQNIILQFIRVLDTYEFGAEPEDEGPVELVDRAFWEKKATPKSLAVVDGVKALVPNEKGEPDAAGSSPNWNALVHELTGRHTRLGPYVKRTPRSR